MEVNPALSLMQWLCGLPCFAEVPWQIPWQGVSRAAGKGAQAPGRAPGVKVPAGPSRLELPGLVSCTA